MTGQTDREMEACTMSDVQVLDRGQDLRDVVQRATAELLRVPPDVAASRPAPAKWSIKEIVGHLIDSASNNHQRFVRAQWTADLVFPGYDQDAWVASQRFAEAPWPDLVVLWRELNLHLARTVAALPADICQRPRHPHNLDRIAFRTVPADQPATLDYFIRDYVGHLEHHLRQIDALRARSVQADAGPA
jgi:hypothetical protein